MEACEIELPRNFSMNDIVNNYYVKEGIARENQIINDVVDETKSFDFTIWQPKDTSLVCPFSFKHKYFSPSITSLLREHNIYPLFRRSGGGVVPFSEGTISIAFAFSHNKNIKSINDSFVLCFEPILKWLKKLGIECHLQNVPGSFCDGKYNLVVDSKKIAGTAQRWTKSITGRSVVFCHAVFLLNADIEFLVKLVNEFNCICKIREKCLARSHINLCDLLDIKYHNDLSVKLNFSDLYDSYFELLSSISKDDESII